MEVINLEKKLDLFKDHWNPRIVGELNDQYVKIAKLKGPFVWHTHENEDELFFVIKGILTIEFRDNTKTLHPGEMLIIPKGVEHRPVANEEVSIMLFEPKSTVNTGEKKDVLTKEKLDWI